jgi:hypothetical protein
MEDGGIFCGLLVAAEPTGGNLAGLCEASNVVAGHANDARCIMCWDIELSVKDYFVAHCAVVVAVVDASVGTIEGAASTMTVLVDVAVWPFWSMTTYWTVSVATADVSMMMLLVTVPLRNVLMPRLRSARGPVMVAPRSL